MENNLYFIENAGCDAVTCGLVSISDEDFEKFESFINNLNKNSYYDCMPVISVYKISIDDLKEIKYNADAAYGDDDYVSKDEVFYFDNKTYTFAEPCFSYHNKLECVIRGG